MKNLYQNAKKAIFKKFLRIIKKIQRPKMLNPSQIPFKQREKIAAVIPKLELMITIIKVIVKRIFLKEIIYELRRKYEEIVIKD